MAYLWCNQNEANLNIPTTEEIASVTYYVITISIGEVKWKVKHRYSEFFNLHNQLVTEHGVSKDILPSKKVIGNKCDVFIETRRKALEEYLQKVFIFLKRTMPNIFVKFLDFHLYDIYFLLQNLSSKCFAEADFILSSTKVFTFNTLELYAVSEILKKPFPEADASVNTLDLGPILDLCAQLNNITIVGSYSEYLQSNIILNNLPFELSAFKIQNGICLKNIALDMICSLGSVRNTLKNLKVTHTTAKNISDVLQCDVLHKNTLEGSQEWAVLEILDLSNNELVEIDQTISLAKNLKSLILNDNKITAISHLTHLPKLEELSMVNNLITVCDELHTKVGNIKTLNLSQNSITSTKGFQKLYSLENLNLSCNKICEVEELQYLGHLPCLDNLILTGNNVSTGVDYRIKVLELFGDKSKDICLDNEKPSQAELDKVAVLRALRIVKEGKTPNLVVESSNSS